MSWAFCVNSFVLGLRGAIGLRRFRGLFGAEAGQILLKGDLADSFYIGQILRRGKGAMFRAIIYDSLGFDGADSAEAAELFQGCSIDIYRGG